MIINTGQRTDIPAFYAPWLCNRLREGFVCVRNPYNPQQVSRYRLDPAVVDLIGFCTKNPAPMLPHLDLLDDYGQYWYVTITPYGRGIEPRVPDKRAVLSSFRELSRRVGTHRVGWRYDPIFVTERYTAAYHLDAFERMCEELAGHTRTVVISFVDLYEKVRRNFPEVRAVSADDKLLLGTEMIRIAHEHDMVVKPCGEGTFLAPFGADCAGCMTISAYEEALGCRLDTPASLPQNRENCACYLACDIGAYDTCAHLCRYCYANNDPALVDKNRRRHDPESPFLIGAYRDDDVIHDVEQRSWKVRQLSLFDAPGTESGHASAR